MTTEQGKITETIVQMAAEAARVAGQAMAVASAENNQCAQNLGPKLDGPIMRQMKFDWSSTDKYEELRNSRMKVMNMLKTVI